MANEDGHDQDEEFTLFVQDSSARLLRYAFLISGSHDDAQELVQQTFVKVYSNWELIRDQAAAEAYARKIITREHISLWRRWGSRERPTMEFDEQSVENPDIELREAVWKALQQLGSRQRTAVVLRFYEDLTEADIAEAMGCSVGTVKSQLSRALANLRKVAGVQFGDVLDTDAEGRGGE